MLCMKFLARLFKLLLPLINLSASFACLLEKLSSLEFKESIFSWISFTIFNILQLFLLLFKSVFSSTNSATENCQCHCSSFSECVSNFRAISNCDFCVLISYKVSRAKLCAFSFSCNIASLLDNASAWEANSSTCFDNCNFSRSIFLII
jgi:hypothetical protein